MSQYTLETILSTVAKENGKKRILYNFGPVGGWNSTIIGLLFLSLPFLEFAALFNPYAFEYLGIAQSIIFFIVFLSMIMILVIGLIFAFNTNLIRKITPSWNEYFPNQDLSMVMSSGITPYSDFFTMYKSILVHAEEKNVHEELQKAFVIMEKDNEELLKAMNRDKNKI
ncbi:hypothetical protein JHD48_00175 [Sulfurimonas sp. SAG-AH-194-I05]|nr:hypothetical protein [Sulfurimonas sp. SAG-AH-194-I05]MDF1874141.1 hypothetical protein [Sulfurimonas sp. SAG-AH-194-I05]